MAPDAGIGGVGRRKGFVVVRVGGTEERANGGVFFFIAGCAGGEVAVADHRQLRSGEYEASDLFKARRGVLPAKRKERTQRRQRHEHEISWSGVVDDPACHVNLVCAPLEQEARLAPPFFSFIPCDDLGKSGMPCPPAPTPPSSPPSPTTNNRIDCNSVSIINRNDDAKINSSVNSQGQEQQKPTGIHPSSKPEPIRRPLGATR